VARTAFICTTEAELLQALTFFIEAVDVEDKVVKFQNNLKNPLQSINLVVIYSGKGDRQCLVEI
jgi:hypothetical protein